jgi:hypothetical protein
VSVRLAYSLTMSNVSAFDDVAYIEKYEKVVDVYSQQAPSLVARRSSLAPVCRFVDD